MGYIPPGRPMSFGEYQSALYTMARIYDVGNQFLGAGAPPRPTGFQRYIQDLYGHRTAGWFPVLNYGLLACMITLAVLVVLAVAR